MGLFDRFRKNIDMNEIEKEYANCKTVEDKEKLIKKINEKMIKADAAATKRLSSFMDDLKNQVEQAKQTYINDSIQREKDIEQFGKRVDGLWNSPGQNKINESAMKTANAIIDEGKKLERENFDKQYAKISAIFSEFSRGFVDNDENNVSFEEKYQTLFKLGIFRTIPKEYIEYAYLVEASKKGVLNANEQALLTNIMNDPNFKEKLSDLYDFSVTAYASLGKYDLDNENLFPQISYSKEVLKKLCHDITRSINSYINNPEAYEKVMVDMTEQKKIHDQMDNYYKLGMKIIDDKNNQIDYNTESQKIVADVVLNPYFGENLTEGERQILYKWNMLKTENKIPDKDKTDLYLTMNKILSKLTKEEMKFEVMFYPTIVEKVESYYVNEFLQENEKKSKSNN